MQPIPRAVSSLRDFGAPSPRLVDGAILVLVGFEVLSGLTSLLVGTSDDGWLFVAHGLAGVSLLPLLYWKLRRVWPRIATTDRWDGATPVSLLLGVVALAALATGVTWSLLGFVSVEGYSLLVGHMVLGVLVVPVLLWHLRHRLRLPTTRDFRGRRTTMRFGVTLVGASVAWRSKEELASLAGLDGAERRFTGSKRAGGEGNAFPVTSWVADDPEPIDVDEYRLTVDGNVRRSAAFSIDDLTEGGTGGPERDAKIDATIDCTSGWYAERSWTGVRLGSVLDAVEPTDEADWVRVRSVTGYRWSFPLEEARDMLLATGVGGEPLAHGHGAPLRLVAPGRRGFQWVKWIDRIEMTRHEDLSQWLAIWVSGFE